METFKNTLCRICLDDIKDDNFRVMDETIIEALDVLLLKLNAEEKDKSVMCNICCMKLFAAFQFKAACMDTEHTISPYLSSQNGACVDLIEIYLKLTGKEQLRGQLDDEKICRLCMEMVTCDFTSVNNVGTDLIQKYIPEINFGATLKPVICMSCLDLLHTYNNFLKLCSGVDENFTKSCNDEDSTFCIKTEEIVIKSEETHEDSEPCLSEDPPDDFKHENKRSVARLEGEHSLEAPISECNILNTQIDHKTWHKNKDCSDDESYACGYQTIQENELLSHRLKHKNLSNARKYKSDKFSSFKTNSENKRDPDYKCDKCTYETKHKAYLTAHQLKHRDVSEVQMYKCDKCNYETKRKGNLVSHALKHKNVSEVQMYKCEKCNYQSKRKQAVIYHQLVHKDISEGQMYKCDQCMYETRHKRYLTSHQVIHRDTSELQMYKCGECNFETKRKKSLVAHALIHKDLSEVQTYKCDVCSYETKHKRSLTTHQFLHRDISDVYKCDKCNYETKQKKSLVAHAIKHKDRSEVQMYKCDTCNYETMYKSHLKSHQLIHKDSSQVTMYKCGKCNYQTKRSDILLQHQLVHKDIFEVQMYKCDTCNYQTKYKKNLPAHEAIHKGLSEVPIYRCCTCNFESKHSSSLMRHQLRHRNSSEVQI